MRTALALVLLAISAAGCAMVQDPPEPATEPPPGWTPFQLALTKNAQIFAKDTAVHGLRFSVVSAQNRQVDGVDIGLGKTFSGGGGGIALSLIWCALWDDFHGIQIAGGMNTAQGAKGSTAEDLNGLQLAILANNATVLSGAQVASVNIGYRIHGMQAGLGNAAKRVFGVQVGGWNIADTVHGFQVGVINTSGATHGLQIALFNTAESGLQIGLVNRNEHGFLPWFPIVNF